jgi:glycine hydroxymethyltransferase
MTPPLRLADPEVAAALEAEARLQETALELNAAAGLASPEVLAAQGSLFGLKTLEGYPGSRFHGGHRNADVIERLAVERAKSLFGAGHANVQPHSGVNANLAVYFAVLEPGDRILGMDLSAGGHLSHGRRGTLSGKFFRSASYGVDPETERIDYEAAERAARKLRPRMIVCGASSYPRTVDFARFRRMADETGALLLADIAHFAGLAAGGVYPSPVPHADFTTFTCYKTLRGARGGIILCREAFAPGIDAAVFPGVQGSMHLHHMAAKAVTLHLASTDAFRAFAARVVENARTLAGALAEGDLRPVTGGTDTHIVLVDLRGRGLTGAEAQERLESAGLIANRNAVPSDPRGPNDPSGLRFGTTALTGRGFGPGDMRTVAELILESLSSDGEPRRLQALRERVRELCRRHPLHEELTGASAFGDDGLPRR